MHACSLTLGHTGPHVFVEPCEAVSAESIIVSLASAIDAARSAMPISGGIFYVACDERGSVATMLCRRDDTWKVLAVHSREAFAEWYSTRGQNFTIEQMFEKHRETFERLRALDDVADGEDGESPEAPTVRPMPQTEPERKRAMADIDTSKPVWRVIGRLPEPDGRRMTVFTNADTEDAARTVGHAKGLATIERTEYISAERIAEWGKLRFETMSESEVDAARELAKQQRIGGPR